MHVPNPLDELVLTDKMSSLNLTEEQQEDDNIRLVLQWCYICESILKARVNQRPHVASYDSALPELAWCLCSVFSRRVLPENAHDYYSGNFFYLFCRVTI